MGNPVLVEVQRGALVESVHRGAVAVADGAGAIVWSAGGIDAPVYPRSAIKPLQAVPLIESGAADRFGFGDEELAIACGSHAGEPGHVAVVERMLVRAGLAVSALQCGAQWPLHQASAHAIARAGATPSPLHNNCSGKHAGFLCAACAMGGTTDGYLDPAHPVQRAVKTALEEFGGATIPEDHCGIDGCSAPNWAMPLKHLARAFALFGTGDRLAPGRAAAARRLRAACAAQPWFVGGTGRFPTLLMTQFGARLFVKPGAEGVMCGALPTRGLGIAIKIDDGAGRAAEVAMAALLERLLPLEAADRGFLAPHIRPGLRNWRGLEVGALRPAAVLLVSLSPLAH
jgi:L-asparaginase II